MDVTIKLINLLCGYMHNKKSYAFPPGTINTFIESPSMIAIIGKNGTGKSTLLKTLAGILSPLKGNIIINNFPFYNLSTIQRAKTLAYLPAIQNRIPYMRVYEYIQLATIATQNKESNIIEQALKITDLEHKKDKPLHYLSDGEMQRAAIARTIAQNTPILLFDEITNHLDPVHQQRIMEQLYKFCIDNRKIILFTSHSTMQAISFSHKVWIVHQNGILEQIPEQLLIDKTLEKFELYQPTIFKNHLIKSPKIGNIRLIGDGMAYQYTKYAFYRYGINTNQCLTCSYSVVIKQENNKTLWILKKENLPIKEFINLQQLIEFLVKNIFI